MGHVPSNLGGTPDTIQKVWSCRWSRAGPQGNLLLAGTWAIWTKNCCSEKKKKSQI